MLVITLLANDDLLKKAQELEDRGEYKEAMQIYKSIVLQKDRPSDSFLEKKEKILEELNTKDSDVKQSIKQIVTSDFGLRPYEKNYFSPFSFSDKKGGGRKNGEAKFQISFKKPVLYDFFGLDESIEFAYTQTSFWQIYKDSLPFRSTDYSPEIFMQFLNDDKDSYLKTYKFGYIHNSNGKGGAESRTWNRFYAKAIFTLNDFFITPTIWYKLREQGDYTTHEDNPDISKYYGYGDVVIMYPYRKNIFELRLRDNLRKDNKGFVDFTWTSPISSGFNSYFWYLNSSYGYGDSLIDYNNKVFRFTLGIAFSR